MGSLQQICLRWNNHQSNFPKVFDELLQSKDLVDVTLTCDGRALDAHKVVLSACSPYFRKLFQNNPCKHPIVFMRDVKYSELEAIIEFMYKGEVNVARDDLTDFLRTAQALQIKGLAEEKNASDKSESVAPKVQQSITLPRSTLPILTPIQPLLNNTNNSNSLLQPSVSKKLKLTHSPSVISSSTPKLSPPPQLTPLHVDSVGNNVPQAQPIRKIEGSSDNMDRLVKLEMPNNDIDDDDESHDEASGEDQQGLDMLMESTLETGEEHYVVGESGDGSMFSHGLEKNADSAAELSRVGASTSGISNQLLQSEGHLFLHSALTVDDLPRGWQWSTEETETLLDIWKHQTVQTRPLYVRKSLDYKVMSNMMLDRSFERNSGQCKNKVKNLKFLYSRYKQTGLMAHGAMPSPDTIRCFQIMDSFLLKRENVKQYRPIAYTDLQQSLVKQESTLTFPISEPENNY